MSERDAPRVFRSANDTSRPHCGICGAEYRSTSYSRATNTEGWQPQCGCWRQLVDENARLRAENVRLREAMGEVALRAIDIIEGSVKP